MESTVLAGVGVRAGVGNILPTPTPAQNRSYHPSTDDDLGRTVIHPYESIERQEEKESGSIQIKPRRHVVIEFRFIKVSELILGLSRSFVTAPMHSKTGMPTIFKGISDNHDRLLPQLARMEKILVYHPFGYNQK